MSDIFNSQLLKGTKEVESDIPKFTVQGEDEGGFFQTFLKKSGQVGSGRISDTDIGKTLFPGGSAIANKPEAIGEGEGVPFFGGSVPSIDTSVDPKTGQTILTATPVKKTRAEEIVGKIEKGATSLAMGGLESLGIPTRLLGATVKNINPLASEEDKNKTFLEVFSDPQSGILKELREDVNKSDLPGIVKIIAEIGISIPEDPLAWATGILKFTKGFKAKSAVARAERATETNVISDVSETLIPDRAGQNILLPSRKTNLKFTPAQKEFVSTGKVKSQTALKETSAIKNSEVTKTNIDAGRTTAIKEEIEAIRKDNGLLNLDKETLFENVEGGVDRAIGRYKEKSKGFYDGVNKKIDDIPIDESLRKDLNGIFDDLTIKEKIPEKSFILSNVEVPKGLDKPSINSIRKEVEESITDETVESLIEAARKRGDLKPFDLPGGGIGFIEKSTGRKLSKNTLRKDAIRDLFESRKKSFDVRESKIKSSTKARQTETKASISDIEERALSAGEVGISKDAFSFLLEMRRNLGKKGRTVKELRNQKSSIQAQITRAAKNGDDPTVRVLETVRERLSKQIGKKIDDVAGDPEIRKNWLLADDFFSKNNAGVKAAGSLLRDNAGNLRSPREMIKQFDKVPAKKKGRVIETMMDFFDEDGLQSLRTLYFNDIIKLSEVKGNVSGRALMKTINSQPATVLNKVFTEKMKKNVRELMGNTMADDFAREVTASKLKAFSKKETDRFYKKIFFNPAYTMMAMSVGITKFSAKKLTVLASLTLLKDLFRKRAVRSAEKFLEKGSRLGKIKIGFKALKDAEQGALPIGLKTGIPNTLQRNLNEQPEPEKVNNGLNSRLLEGVPQ